MKRLLSLLIVLGIIAYITVQVIKDRRFNKLSEYDYPISENIDKDYHDVVVLKDYYKTVMEIGTFARSVWRTKMHDVRQPEQGNPDEDLDRAYYESLIGTAKQLERILERSRELKDQGYTVEQVRLIMDNNVNPEELRIQEKYYLVGLGRGSNGESVWELQKMLNTRGDSIPVDGIFNLITVNRLKEFQTNNGLFPSGEVTENTLKALLK